MGNSGKQILFAGGAAAFTVSAVASWWGARRLKTIHRRSTAAGPVQAPRDGTQRIAVVINPVKNHADAAREQIRHALQTAGWPEAMFLETTVDDPGHGQARQALEEKYDAVLAAGGDGTVRAVAEVLAGSGVPLGLVPLGTGNLLARNLDMDVADLRGSIGTALFGGERRIDTAAAELESSVDGTVSRHVFLVMAGIGMDAEVLVDTRDDLKKSIGWLAYTAAGLRHLGGRRKSVTISLDGSNPQKRKIRSILFANCGLVPGGIDFLPDAMVDDGLLDAVVISPRSLVGWLIMYLKVVFKHSGVLPIMRAYPVKRMTVWSPEPMETQLDGDPSGPVTRVSVEVRPQSLSVRVQPSGLCRRVGPRAEE
ncbi:MULTISPECIES: diacylglycerol kinase family protein [Arthrobacter]|uniref:Diacylglycerol kinase family protein n=2 Tax=Arthrobacter TaxID=1663 RepID=A0ABU9KJP2_9MICC|nr:diacylglycerol kinase family protein [Arthrobacter sp. YJM1]MDP5226976.1 diacylglycerol kinase family protein [Arthrobacter sp. YJM1]